MLADWKKDFMQRIRSITSFPSSSYQLTLLEAFLARSRHRPARSSMGLIYLPMRQQWKHTEDRQRKRFQSSIICLREGLFGTSWGGLNVGWVNGRWQHSFNLFPTWFHGGPTRSQNKSDWASKERVKMGKSMPERMRMGFRNSGFIEAKRGRNWISNDRFDIYNRKGKTNHWKYDQRAPAPMICSVASQFHPVSAAWMWYSGSPLRKSCSNNEPSSLSNVARAHLVSPCSF